MSGKQKIAILGAAESGVGAALLAQSKGYDVFVSDNGKIREDYKNVLLHHGIKFEEGKHTESLILSAGEIIKSPGIPDENLIIQLIRANGKQVISDIEFTGRYTSAKKICITGSNGKTTTASLLFYIMKKAGFNVALAGNIGKSFALQVLSGNYEYYVLEISSFQLDGMFGFGADVAILTNITPDHLDRYENDFRRYANSKFRILQNMSKSGSIIYNADDPVIAGHIESINHPSSKYPFSLKSTPFNEGAFIMNHHLTINIHKKKFVMTLENLALQGRHNIANSMAAGIAARLFDIRKDIIKECLTDFQSVEHRLEFVAKVHGIDFINDSKATNVNSTWFALESMTRPVIWIVGGLDKGNDYSSLKALVKAKVKAIVCLGTDNSKIISEFADIVGSITECSTADDAVSTAYYKGTPGDVVLLSPACASFDLFKNYEDRGAQFKRAVFDL